MKLNKKKLQVLRMLAQNDQVWRPEMSEELGIPSSSLYHTLRKFLKQQLVEKVKEKREEVGRPKIFWKITNRGKIAWEQAQKALHQYLSERS